jgi:hypothetical protein
VSGSGDRYNEFAKKHGAKKEVWDEDLKFKYQNKSLREYRASIYTLAYQEFPVTAFTSEAVYLQWCIQVSGMMPPSRGRDFKEYMRQRLAEAEEEEIPPNMEEGIEVGVVILTILKNAIRNIRDFDYQGNGEEGEDKLRPGEWLFAETAEDSRCGKELFIKYEGLKARVLHEVVNGSTETKLTRREVVKWLRAHGRCYGRDATVNRRRSAYVLPYDMVEKFEVFALRAMSNPFRAAD